MSVIEIVQLRNIVRRKFVCKINIFKNNFFS